MTVKEDRHVVEIDTVDVHVGGDVHRIVVGGVEDLPGTSVLEQMQHLRDEADALRLVLLEEPRGGLPSLFADLIVPPVHPDADAGFIIMERMGYPLISGTNTMSTAIALVETGKVSVSEGSNDLTLEAPGGLINVSVECRDGRVETVEYQAQTPSFVAERGLTVSVPGWGDIQFDVIWTGAFYPIVDAGALDIGLTPQDEEELVRFSKAFVEAARQVCHPIHPEFGDEGPLSFVIIAGDPVRRGPSQLTREVNCYEYPRSSICRSPAGVPSTAATVQLVDRGFSADDLAEVRTVSAFGHDLVVRVVENVEYHGLRGTRVTVKGRGWITMRSRLVIDFADPMNPTPGLRAITRALA